MKTRVVAEAFVDLVDKDRQSDGADYGAWPNVAAVKEKRKNTAGMRAVTWKPSGMLHINTADGRLATGKPLGLCGTLCTANIASASL